MKPPKTYMTTEPKNKILLIIIAVLLITNIVLVTFLLINKPSSKKGMRGDRSTMIAAFLQNEIGFDQQQLKQYDSLNVPNRTKIKAMFDTLKSEKENQFKQLTIDNFSDTAILKTANNISAKQKEIEIVLYKHYKEIRNICDPKQLPKFDSLFYKILNKKYTPQKNNNK